MSTVLVCDDEPLVRTGLRTILEANSDIHVVGEAVDGHDAVAQSRQLHPDVILMDIRMPNCDGITATRELLADSSLHPAVIMLTTFDTDDYVHDALTAGASGFLFKSAPADEIAHAVRKAADGELLLAPQITRRLVDHYLQQRERPGHVPGIELLTDRERDVLTLIGHGHANADIATALFLSEATIKTHINRIFAKLAVRDRAQAVVAAYEARLVRPGTH